MIDSLQHHAYGIAGQAEEVVPRLLLALEKEVGYRAKGNPDFRLESFEVMGIDEARAQKEAAERKAVTEGKKVFIVSARGITKEAQNALLKVFEEPPLGTHFFLIVPSIEILLPTLRSRLFVIRVDSGKPVTDVLITAQFLSGNIPSRLTLIQEMLKDLENEKKKRGDAVGPSLEKGRIMAFLNALERTLAEKNLGSISEALEEVLKVKKYSHDRAPSFKLLLEHLALVLPKIM